MPIMLHYLGDIQSTVTIYGLRLRTPGHPALLRQVFQTLRKLRY
jgi:hypothetical protein